jgi:hypothetical protein
MMQAFLKAMLSENNGNPSSIRLVGVLGPLIVLGTWAYISISTGEMVTPEGWDMLMLLGLPAAKVWQKGKEV